MKTLFYKENTIALLQFLKSQMPKRIFSDQHCQVIFDYTNFYIAAYPEVSVAASQNKGDEIINAKFEHINSAFQPNEYDKLLFHNNVINRLWILRTMLYFTDLTFFNSEAEAVGDFQIETKTDRILADIIRKSTSGHDEVVCHPKSTEAESVNRDYANLVDAGIILEIDDKLLMCFSWNNGFGIVGETMLPNELKDEIIPFYEFLEIV